MNPATLQPIATLLIRRVFKWVLLCVVAFSSIQAWLSYTSIEKNFNAAVRDVADTHLPLLSVAIWDIEPQAIQKQIGLILKNTSIAYVSVKASTGQSFFIVTIEVLLLVVLILTAVVAILRRDLERPMRQLATYVRNIQADQLSSDVQLHLPIAHAYSEIDLVFEGFQIMQNSIKQHILNQDALVMERTGQLEKVMESLKQLSITDGLTECYNRQLFNERMPGEIQRANRYDRTLSIVFCDIDFFKTVNDQYGHSVGDKVLVAFAHCLKEEIRIDVDWVVRYGGEEFVVVLPETRLACAIAVAERMRRRVENELKVIIAGGESLKITASFGVAQKTETDNIDSLVNRADEWLYAAKTGGRNQVRPKKSV